MSHAATSWPRKTSQVLPAASRYGLAVLAVAVAWLVRQALDRVLGDAQAFPTFYVTVALVAWWAGWRPAVLALILGYLTADWFFLPPRYSLGAEDWKNVVELVTYFFVGGTSILCIASLRKAEKQARDNAHALQEEKMELEIHIQKRKQVEEILARSRQELERLVKERTAKL